MEQNQIHILKEKMQDLKHERNIAEFNRKRALYQDHFFDADMHEAKRDEIQAKIDSVREQIQELLVA